MNFLGFKLPFDRHDWVVDRCGKDVRYIIDFYNGAFFNFTCFRRQSSASFLFCAVMADVLISPSFLMKNAAKSSDPRQPIAMHLDARPALDSAGAIVDRLYVQGAWTLSGGWLNGR